MPRRKLFVTRVGRAVIEISPFQRGANAEFIDDEHAVTWCRLRTELVCRIFEESTTTFVFSTYDLIDTLPDVIRQGGFEFEFENSSYRAVRVENCSRTLLRAIAEDQKFELACLDIVRMPIDDESRLRRLLHDLSVDFLGTPKPAEECVNCINDAFLLRWFNPIASTSEALLTLLGPTIEFCGFDLHLCEINKPAGSES